MINFHLIFFGGSTNAHEKMFGKSKLFVNPDLVVEGVVQNINLMSPCFFVG